MNDPDTKYVPRYDMRCQNCGQTPTVTIEDSEGNVITDFEMCGPCVFGEADTLDPENW